MAQDEELRQSVEAALAPLVFLPIDVTVDDGIVYLNGTVRSGEEAEQAIKFAEEVEGVKKVVNRLAISEVTALDLEAEGEPFEEESLEILEVGSSFDPDFSDAIGTTDVMQSTSENEVFFPPTDPVVYPVQREKEGIEVLGGFAPTSEDEVSEPVDHPPKVYHSDDEMAEDVRLALLRDASTASLNIRVIVRNRIAYLRGRVQSIEDVDQAEAVASQVPGIVEVREELEY